MSVVVLPVLGICVYLACFTALDPPHPVLLPDDKDPLKFYLRCEFNLNWVIAPYVVEAFGLVCCLYLVWVTRKIELLRFNESSHIAICIYCLLILGIILVPTVHWLSKDANSDGDFVIESVCIIVAGLTVSSAILVPKYKAILTGKQDKDGSLILSPTDTARRTGTDTSPYTSRGRATHSRGSGTTTTERTYTAPNVSVSEPDRTWREPTASPDQTYRSPSSSPVRGVTGTHQVETPVDHQSPEVSDAPD